MKALKSYKKFLCWDDEGEPILILQFGAIRQLSEKTVQVILWNSKLHRALKGFGKNAKSFDGNFTNFWEDGEFTIKLRQYDFTLSSLPVLVLLLGDKPGYLTLGNEYLYTTLVQGKIKRSVGSPWKRAYVIFNLNELTGVNFTRKKYDKKLRAIAGADVWQERLKRQTIAALKATAEEDLKINRELEGTLADGLEDEP